MSEQVVVITGASSGIGAATARLLAREGTSLALVARRKDALTSVAEECGPQAVARVADVGRRDQVRDVVEAALAQFGRIDVWINNAGQGISRPPSEMLGRIPFAVTRSAYCGAKHFLNALTASMRAEVQPTHPGIQFSLVSPGVVRTDFGLNAVHGGPDSRQWPDAQSPEDVAAVIAGVMRSRQPDVYTRKGAHDRVAAYYSQLGIDA